MASATTRMRDHVRDTRLRSSCPVARRCAWPHVAGAAALLFVLLGMLADVRAAAAPQPERAWEHTRFLVRDIGPRPASSEAVAQAEDYVERHFSALGLEVARVAVGTRALPAIELAGDLIEPARERSADDDVIVGRLAATVDSPGPAIVIMAHVDTVPDAPGAIDNAAAVGVLLELARSLAATEVRPHPIVFAATAAEEIGLLGARALAADDRLGPVGLAISLDLIGRSGPITLNGLSAHLGESGLERIRRASEAARVAVEAPLTHQVVSRLLPQLERSDHGAFTERGVPAFHLFHRGPGRIYLDYHRPTDDLDQVDAASLAATLALLTEIALDPAPLPTMTGEAPSRGATWFGGGILVGHRALWWLELLLVAAVLVAQGVSLRRSTWHRRAWSGAAIALGVCLAAWLVLIGLDAALGRAIDHPQPWIHGPGRASLATLLLLGGLLLLGASALRRHPELATSAGTWSVILASAPGVALWLLGVPELAWLPLLSAAALALVGVVERPRARAILLALGLYPGWACVDPELLREASFHGFLPAQTKLAWILAVPFFATSLAVVRLLAPLPIRTPHRVLAVAAALVLWLAISLGAPLGRWCEPEAFVSEGLACERHAAR